MRISDLLIEALKLSQARKYVKGWDKNRYKVFFKKYAADEKAYRIYLPLLKPLTPKKSVPIPASIQKTIEDQGFVVDDYVAGIATNKDGIRKVKIGKLLSDKPEESKLFASDKNRQGTKASADALVVISRHPYDVAAMSTGRGWTSCMDMIGGVNNQYVIEEVNTGTIIAYAIHSDDKNINNPIGRVLIKPFINVQDKSDILLVREEKIYGTEIPGFFATVDKFLEKINEGKEGLYCVNDDSYLDTETPTFKNTFTGLKAQIYDNPELIATIEDPSEELQMIAVRKSMKVIGKIKRPSEAVQIFVAKISSYGLQFIINAGIKPSEAVQLAAVKNDGSAIKYLIIDGMIPSEQVQQIASSGYGVSIKHIIGAGIKPSEAVQLAAVGHTGDVIKYIIKAGIIPSEAVQLQATSNDGETIKYIINAGINPSEAVQLASIKTSDNTIPFLRNGGIIPYDSVLISAIKSQKFALIKILSDKFSLSEAVQIAAVEHDWNNIKDLLEYGIIPSEAVQLAAVKQDNNALEYIKKSGITPSRQVLVAAGAA